GIQGYLRVFDSHPHPDFPPQGPARRSRAGAGMIRSGLAVAALAISVAAVAIFPRSVLAFLLFQGSLLAIYLARMPGWLRGAFFAVALLVMMPIIGSYNGYYLEIATQVGIFVALALGLTFVLGLAGLLALGSGPFFAVGV